MKINLPAVKKAESPEPASTWLSSETLYSIGLVPNGSYRRDISPNRESQEEHAVRIPDRPTALIPSKGMSHYIKSSKFVPYKSTRPDLLRELNEMIEKGNKELKTLQLENDTMKRYELYRSVFARFVEESTIYQPVLSAVRTEYDHAVEHLTHEIRSFALFDAKLEKKQSEHASELESVTAAGALRARQLEDQLRVQTARAASLEKDKTALEAELRGARETSAALRKECEDLRATGVTLTNSLSRLEEDKRLYQIQDAVCQSEVAVLQGNELKLNEEIERLQQIIQAMETLQSSMVSHEVVTAQETALEAMRSEVKRVDTTHRHLLLRYTAIKAAADAAFKKFEANREGTADGQSVSSGFEQARVQSKVREVVSDHHAGVTRVASRAKNNRRAVTAPTDPAEKLMQLVERGASGKLVIESLLDIIEQHQSEGRGNGHNASDHGSTLLSNVLPNGTVAFDGDFSPAAEDFRSPWSHFDGLGFEPPVPSYLRFNGKLQNLFMSRMELVLLINEMWALKTFHERTCLAQQQLQASNNALSTAATNTYRDPSVSQVTAESKPTSAAAALRPVTSSSYTTAIMNNSGLALSPFMQRSLPPNPSLALFLELYLEDRFAPHMRAVEMAYNIVDALRKYAACSDCMLFSAILENRLCQDVWSDQHVVTDKIKVDSTICDRHRFN